MVTDEKVIEWNRIGNDRRDLREYLEQRGGSVEDIKKLRMQELMYRRGVVKYCLARKN